MLSLSSDLKIFAYTRPTDMRKGCDGLSGIVRSEFQSDPTDGSLFIFINRRRDRMKLLHFDGAGYWLCYPKTANSGIGVFQDANGSAQRGRSSIRKFSSRN